MKILVIGGTGFIGPFVVRDLAAAGHEVAVFHRGGHVSDLPPGVVRLQGDRRDLAAHGSPFAAYYVAEDAALSV